MLLSLATTLLWVGLLVLFLAGAVAYAFKPQLGVELLKRSAILMLLLLLIRVLFAW